MDNCIAAALEVSVCTSALYRETHSAHHTRLMTDDYNPLPITGRAEIIAGLLRKISHQDNRRVKSTKVDGLPTARVGTFVARRSKGAS